LALGADRESLAMEIAYLMPNQLAVEGAIKYAQSRHRSLAQKLTEVAQQKLDEELNELEYQYQETNQDELGPLPGKSSVINVVKNPNEVNLKPKPMKQESVEIENSNSRQYASDSESGSELNTLDEDTNTNDSNALKPKVVKGAPTKQGNPFKVVNNNSKRRTNSKAKSDSSDSDEDYESDHRSKTGFQQYFEEMYEQIQEDNSDVEDEEKLRAIAKEQYQALDSKEKKEWTKKASSNSKRKANHDRSEKRKKSKQAGNSVAKFFKKQSAK
jgi:hypothetical protein